MSEEIGDILARAKAARDRCQQLVREYRDLCSNGERLRVQRADLVEDASRGVRDSRGGPDDS